MIVFQVTTENNKVQSRTTGGPAGHSGDPAGGNKTCNTAGCHIGVTPIAANGLITSNIPASGYIPGSTYTVTASITRPGHTKFGFQVTPQNATGTILGTLIATSTQTQLNGINNSYITHNSSGTSGSGAKTWTFNWTAPSAGSGNVKFYAAFNASNSNNSSSGDTIFTSSLTIPENLSTGINSISRNESNLSVYPNPVKDKINITFSTIENQDIEVILSDIMGKVSEKLYSGKTTNTTFNYSIDIEGKYPSGIYLLKIKEGNKLNVKKVIIE